METNLARPADSGQPEQISKPSTDEMLLAIYNNTHKTTTYMKWQLYITVVLVVLPILAMVVLLPLVLKSLGTLSGVYGSGGLLQ
ncbi:MAG: hypothetical protein KGJ93_00180 [Patescibacteria group bacterium]|nr:hypothetical protein [Patescibacteria group bacterium]